MAADLPTDCPLYGSDYLYMLLSSFNSYKGPCLGNIEHLVNSRNNSRYHTRGCVRGRAGREKEAGRKHCFSELLVLV